jgi:hypothetical protein
MRKTLIIITVTLLAALLLLGACTPTEGPEQPTQDQINFYLVSDAAPGDTDAYASYILSIYLESEQELALAFSAQGAALRVSIFTPSEETYGYRSSATQDSAAGDTETEVLGRLKKGEIVSAEEGSFRFTAPETGYYALTIQSASPKAEIDVHLEYQIQ